MSLPIASRSNRALAETSAPFEVRTPARVWLPAVPFVVRVSLFAIGMILLSVAISS